MVVFAAQNVIMDPPFTKLEIITCRNLLIYFTVELQKKLLPMFNYCLNPGGILFLGSAESIGSFTDLYTPLDIKMRLYQRSNDTVQTTKMEFPSRLHIQHNVLEESKTLPTSVNLQTVADQLLLNR